MFLQSYKVGDVQVCYKSMLDEPLSRLQNGSSSLTELGGKLVIKK